jgi:2-(1,2-epoxy-1,2-dihydrophenyl)acetyl-CoA isomerase
MTTVSEFANMLAQGPTQAYGNVKELVDNALTDTLESQMEMEARSIGELSKTQDGQEGVQAFIQKRPPQFKGA